MSDRVIARGELVAGDRLLSMALLKPGELEAELIAALPVQASASRADNELRAVLTRSMLKAKVDALLIGKNGDTGGQPQTSS